MMMHYNLYTLQSSQKSQSKVTIILFIKTMKLREKKIMCYKHMLFFNAYPSQLELQYI